MKMTYSIYIHICYTLVSQKNPSKTSSHETFLHQYFHKLSNNIPSEESLKNILS